MMSITWFMAYIYLCEPDGEDGMWPAAHVIHLGGGCHPVVEECVQRGRGTRTIIIILVLHGSITLQYVGTCVCFQSRWVLISQHSPTQCAYWGLEERQRASTTLLADLRSHYRSPYTLVSGQHKSQVRMWSHMGMRLRGSSLSYWQCEFWKSHLPQPQLLHTLLLALYPCRLWGYTTLWQCTQVYS